MQFTKQALHWAALSAAQALLAVAAGAFGAHGLKSMVAPQNLEWWQTACQYLMYHSLAGLVGVLLSLHVVSVLRSAYFFTAGNLLFAGSLMVMTLTDVRILGVVTPLGGVLYLVAWLWMITSVLKAAKKASN